MIMIRDWEGVEGYMITQNVLIRLFSWFLNGR